MPLLTVHHSSGTDWTLVGVLLTAIFTGLIFVLGAWSWFISRRENRRDRVEGFAHALKLGTALRLRDISGNRFLDVRIEFRNRHTTALRYEITDLSIKGATANPEMVYASKPAYMLSTALVVQRDEFTVFDYNLGPMPATVDEPKTVQIDLGFKYGLVPGRYEWAEKHSLLIESVPGAPSKDYEGYDFKWIGNPSIERLKRPRWWSRRHH